MPDAIITSTASTFGTISGTFAADQSTVTGTVTGIVAGTLSGSVGVPGPAGAGVPAGGTAGQYLQKIDGVDYNTDWVTLNLSGYAPLNSPAFTGNPTAPTAALGDNDTSLATTAFVQQELLSGTANAKNLEVYVRNQTGSTLAAGAIVYINGATGNRPTVTLAQANNDANSAQTMGFVKTAIANNGFGYVIVRGEIEGLDTQAVAEGTQLYLSPTTAGAYTTTKPSAPQHLVYVGIVIRSHPTQGVILVAVQNGYELNELHDVSITSPTNGQVLKYNSTTGLWYNGTDSAGVAWGGITGTLSSQTDLQTALDGKYSTTNPAGYITSSALTGYATETFVTSQGYITSAALSPYLTSATAASTYQTLSGMSSYLTTASAASTYAPIASPTFTGLATFDNPGNYAISVPASGVGYDIRIEGQLFTMRNASTEVIRISPGGIKYPDGVTQSVAYPGPSGFLLKADNLSGLANTGTARTNLGLGTMATETASNYLTTATASTIYAPLASPALTGNVTITTNSTSPALVITQDGTGDVVQFKDVTSDTTYSFIDQNGKVNTVASTTTSAGFNVPHGTAPTSPVNGDVWTTTGNLWVRINGASQAVALQGSSAQLSSNNIFTNASSTYGNSTAAGTINLGTGATISGATKAVNIGTSGVAGSTTNIAIGSTTGTSTTTLQGTTNGVTVAADTNSTALATTAYVVGQAGSATPLVDGTAAVGTSLRYARQDHVHPTDTTRAPLASPALTGTPTAPTATAGTNTTQIATTAFVTAAVPALATLSDARQFTNDTKAMSPRDVIWSMLTPDFVDISGPSMTTTNTGTITYVQVGQLSRVIRPGNAGACSSRIRTFGTSQVDQTWTASSRAQPSSFLNFSLRSIHSGRSTTGGVTDANYTCAFYYGKAEADGTGDLIRRGYGWKMVGGVGSRFLQLQAHNGTTLSSVTSSFAVTAGVAFDWDIESDGAGNVTLYVNGSSVATSSGGPTGAVNITGVAWQEEVVAAAALSSPYMDFTNSRGRYIVINTW